MTVSWRAMRAAGIRTSKSIGSCRGTNVGRHCCFITLDSSLDSPRHLPAFSPNRSTTSPPPPHLSPAPLPRTCRRSSSARGSAPRSTCSSPAEPRIRATARSHGDFLAVATPGAGKTTFALTCARERSPTSRDRSSSSPPRAISRPSGPRPRTGSDSNSIRTGLPAMASPETSTVSSPPTSRSPRGPPRPSWPVCRRKGS